MVDPFTAIADFLKNNNIRFETIEHEPVYTSEQAATFQVFDRESQTESVAG